MKASELMIGDWVLYNETPQQILEISGIDDEVYLEIDELVHQSEIQPIPLTPEILEKNGFKLDTYSGEFMSGKWWTRNDFVIHESMNDSVGNNNFSYKYVHQLQHALRLCGIEKEIEL